MVVENRSILAAEERALRRRVARSPAPTSHNGHILIAAPGNGNVGDQAALEAFVAGVEGRVTIVVRRASDLAALPPESEARVQIVPLPGLLYGTPWQAVSAGSRLVELLQNARSLSVIGADVMDGVYWEAPSIRRFRAAGLAAELGLPARILGFSWSEHPTRLARDTMARTSAIVDLCARDPISAARLLADGAVRLTEVADLAFQTRRAPLPEELRTWLTAQRAERRRIVLLNSNGLIERLASTVAAYRDVIARAGRDTVFVAVPHVSRGTPSDVDLARDLGTLVADPTRLAVIDELLAPGQVAELAAQADLVVTGRMHLAILSATVGTPAVTIGYQGKVAGLYESLAIDTWLDVDARTRERLPDLVLDALERAPQLRSSVEAALPALLERSRRNVRGLAGVLPESPDDAGAEHGAR